MPEMGVTLAANQLGPDHAVAQVALLDDAGGFEFAMKAGPAATGMKLAAGIEQRVATAHAPVLAGLEMIAIFAAEGPLGTRLAGDAILFGIKFAAHHPQAAEVKKSFIYVKSLDDWRAALDRWYGSLQ